jgi:hypothetical protein
MDLGNESRHTTEANENNNKGLLDRSLAPADTSTEQEMHKCDYQFSIFIRVFHFTRIFWQFPTITGFL